MPYDVSVDGIGVFIADNGLVDLDAPRLSTNIDREAFKITLTDPSFEFRDFCNNNITGSRVIVRIGFMNTLDEVVVGTTNGGLYPSGAAILDIGDMIISYAGVVDVPAYEATFDGEPTLLTIECASPMATLDLVNPFYTSKDALDQRVFVELNDQTDTAFDNVYAGSQAMSVAWGKK